MAPSNVGVKVAVPVPELTLYGFVDDDATGLAAVKPGS
jgi:hypothetical protein